MKKIWCYCAVSALFYFEFEGNFRLQAPRGLYDLVFGGTIYRRVFYVTSLGGLYLVLGGAYI